MIKQSQMIFLSIIFFVCVFMIFYFYFHQKKRFLNITIEQQTIEFGDLKRKNIEDFVFNGDIEFIKKLEKPILWIYIPYEYNSRHWQSFYSRGTLNLNQPYILLTIQSIIQKNYDDFYIFIIDENSFDKLIPNYSIEMNKFSSPVKDNLKTLSLLKLLFLYGGLILPMSFLCFQPLISLYETGTRNNKLLVGETVNRNITCGNYTFSPNIQFIGSQPDNPNLLSIIQYTQHIISTDYTDASVFIGKINNWCRKNPNVYLVPAHKLGTGDKNDNAVLVDNLLERDYIPYAQNMYGIWIPHEEIVNRLQYEWFCRMSKEQVLNGNIILSKYILLALGPGSVPQVEEFTDKKKDWVSFWKVPSGAPVWGLKPNYLGKDVLKKSF